MTYSEATEYLFTQTPVFQNIGAGAYKPGLDTARQLAGLFGNPHHKFKSIHVAGTNGKGSTSHSIAAVLQSAGYKVGLYTSPHLADFRERIRVNGQMIEPEYVVDFVSRFQAMHADCSPSFFELTMTMAFEYFARSEVDVAVIEVGLGGRLDSTNIIAPSMCVITNISLEHTNLLGNTEEAIAAEKAGIMKPAVPVVIGEAMNPGVRKVFENKANEVGCPIQFAEDTGIEKRIGRNELNRFYINTPEWGMLEYELAGDCQKKNLATGITALKQLAAIGFTINREAAQQGLANVTTLTGLQGRWQVLGHNPLQICDTGHNIGGWKWLAPQINRMPGTKHIVIGFAGDKDVSGILHLIEGISNKRLIFTQSSVNRAMPAERLKAIAAQHGLDGDMCPDVKEAYEMALRECRCSDSVFVGGSSFVVADLLKQ